MKRPGSVPKLRELFSRLEVRGNYAIDEYAFDYAWFWLNGGRKPVAGDYEGLPAGADAEIRKLVKSAVGGR